MPFQIVRNDLTKMKVDAIVNAANSSLLGGGGVDGAIHKAAGEELLKECKTLGGCEVGEAKITSGYNLFSKYIIHTVGPIWQGGNSHEKELLESCFKNSLALAKEYSIQSIAFPLISTGAYGFPKDLALKIAMATISDFLLEHDMDIYLVVFDRKAVTLSEKLFVSITQYIDDVYVDQQISNRRSYVNNEDLVLNQSLCCEMHIEAHHFSLENIVENLDETFVERLFRFIDQKGMSDVEAYKRANIDRKLFSKIRSNLDYKPSKNTAIAFAIALELHLDDTLDLLNKAGYTLSTSSKFDVIIQYCIEHKIYKIYEVNQILFHFDLKTLG